MWQQQVHLYDDLVVWEWSINGNRFVLVSTLVNVGSTNKCVSLFTEESYLLDSWIQNKKYNERNYLECNSDEIGFTSWSSKWNRLLFNKLSTNHIHSGDLDKWVSFETINELNLSKPMMECQDKYFWG